MSSAPDRIEHVEACLQEEPENAFPPGLAAPALRALHGAGYTRLDQLATVTEAELRQLHGMGPKAIATLREALKARGMTFAGKVDD